MRPSQTSSRLHSQKNKSGKGKTIPTYTFRNKDTGEEYNVIIPMSQYDDYLKENNVERVYSKPASLISGYHQKPDNGFRDLLKKIDKGAGLQSNVNTW